MPEKHTAKFWARVTRGEGCWLYGGPMTRAGYGMVYDGNGGGSVPAHRYAYTLERGPIPEGQQVAHNCDTPACVRPDHLFLASALENHKDRVRKGRTVGMWVGFQGVR